jgi:hypothetical protein
MQNQQTQQNPQNGTQPFFPMGQGPNNFDPYQAGAENNSNTATRQGSEISSQIGGVAIDGATINRVATGASQAESSIPDAQEPLGIQTPPNAIDDAPQKRVLNPEIGGMKTEAANITPLPPQESQSSKDEQNADDRAQTDGLPHMVLNNVGDSLSKENQHFVKKLIEDAPENPFEFYQKAIEARNGYSESIRRGTT